MRSLAEAGAGVVIGHHVHVPQAWEVWNGSLIFYSLGDFYMDEVWGGRYPARDWSILPRIRVVDGKVTGATVHGFERVADRIEPLGRLRSSERARQYLIELGGSTTGPDFGALWQEAAFQQLPFYIQEFAGALPVVETWASTFRGRVRQSLQTVRNVARLWSGADTSPPLAPRAALTWLNIMRCESHREMVETALAVHGKEQPDGRTADSARRWAALRSEMSLLSPAG